MRIVVLDGETLNPGDNPWAGLAALGDLEIHPRTPASEIVARARGAGIVLTNKTPLDAATLAALHESGLRFVAVLATGYNVVDVAAAARLGIPVSNVPVYGTKIVAQHALALLLELCHHVGLHDRSVQAGDWSASPDFCYWKKPVVELDGKILGLVGVGKIGEAFGKVAEALGMTVWATPSRSGKPDPRGWAAKPIPEMFTGADVVSLHCPQTAENAGFVNRALLETMKPSAFLINTARGGLVNEADLAAALKAGKLAGAAVDVVSKEPIAKENPLLGAPNCLITPHIAWSSLEARRRLLAVTVENVRNYLAGTPSNRVN